MTTPAPNDFTVLYPQALQLLRRGWLPISIFFILSILGWIWVGSLPTLHFELLYTDPVQFIWTMVFYFLKIALISMIVAAFTLGPATFWLLRIHREAKQTIAISDILIGIFIPALLDFILGAAVSLSVFGFGLITFATFLQYANVLPQTVNIVLLMVFLIMFGMIFMMLIGVIYPRLRWLAVASLSGDCAVTGRLGFARRFPRESLRILWRVTALEQITALILTIIGGIIASQFIAMPSLSFNPYADPGEQLSTITNLISAGSGPAIAVLNGLGWIAIWLFLPLWIVVYEWLPKPISAARLSEGIANSSTSQTRL